MAFIKPIYHTLHANNQLQHYNRCGALDCEKHSFKLTHTVTWRCPRNRNYITHRKIQSQRGTTLVSTSTDAKFGITKYIPKKVAECYRVFLRRIGYAYHERIQMVRRPGYIIISRWSLCVVGVCLQWRDLLKNGVAENTVFYDTTTVLCKWI